MTDEIARDFNWDFKVLHPLRDGNPTHLKTIYAAIGGLEEGGYINQKLFKVDGRWGDRKDYTHVVRSTMNSLKKRGLVEHVGKGRTGKYLITDLGRKHLEKIEP